MNKKRWKTLTIQPETIRFPAHWSGNNHSKLIMGCLWFEEDRQSPITPYDRPTHGLPMVCNGNLQAFWYLEEAGPNMSVRGHLCLTCSLPSLELWVWGTVFLTLTGRHLEKAAKIMDVRMWVTPCVSQEISPRTPSIFNSICVTDAA